MNRIWICQSSRSSRLNHSTECSKARVVDFCRRRADHTAVSSAHVVRRRPGTSTEGATGGTEAGGQQHAAPPRRVLEINPLAHAKARGSAAGSRDPPCLFPAGLKARSLADYFVADRNAAQRPQETRSRPTHSAYVPVEHLAFESNVAVRVASDAGESGAALPEGQACFVRCNRCKCLWDIAFSPERPVESAWEGSSTEFRQPFPANFDNRSVTAGGQP